jgi:lipid-A-disaccharide synthase
MQVLESQHGLAHPLPQIAGEKIVALLPGSRKQEILKKLPEMLSVVNDFPNYHFAIAQAPGLDDEWFASLVPSHKNVHIVKDNTYALLNHSVAALVTSGTATLETALLGIPEIVCYKGNPITLALAKRFVKIKYIALVNLIMDKEVVKELIQEYLNQKNLVKELELLLNDEAKKAQIASDYQLLKERLYTGQSATEVAADIVLHELTH